VAGKSDDGDDQGLRAVTRGAVLPVLFATLVSAAAQAQTPEPDLAAASPRAAPSLRRLSYLVGDWTVETFTRQAGGAFVADTLIAFYRARWLRDGLMLMTESFESSASGFHGVHLVTYSDTAGLVHRYSDARRGQLLEFRGAFAGDHYHITRRGGYNGRGSFLYREVDSEIAQSGFLRRILLSDDDGRTWREGDYRFRYHRR
jgi:hypothetical protein